MITIARDARGYHLSGRYFLRQHHHSWPARRRSRLRRAIPPAVLADRHRHDAARQVPQGDHLYEELYQRPFGLCEGSSADHFMDGFQFSGVPVDQPPETGADPGEGGPPISGTLGSLLGVLTPGRLGKDEAFIDTGPGGHRAPAFWSPRPSIVRVRSAHTSSSMRCGIGFGVPRKILEASSRARCRAEPLHYCGQPPPIADAKVTPGEVTSNSMPSRLGRRRSPFTGNRTRRYQYR